MTALRLLAAALLSLTSSPAIAQAPDYRRHTSPDLQRFGSDDAFLRYLAEARAAAHARGTWWYDDPDTTGSDTIDEDPPELENESDEEDPGTPGDGLEVIPGSHGDYDVQEHNLADGSALFYSFLDMTEIRPGAELVWPGFRPRGEVRAGSEPGGWESLRRLLAAAARDPLYRLADIHRPVRDTLESTVHAITVCPPEAMANTRPDFCRTTAFVGPRGGELLVTATHAYLWTVPEYGDLEELRRDPDCPARAAAIHASGLPSLIYRLPLAGGGLEVIGARGQPAWGSELQAAGERLRAFAASPRITCGEEGRIADLHAPPARLGLIDAPLTLFATRLREAPPPVELPQLGTWSLASGFVGDWLLYGASAYDFAMPRADDAPRAGRLLAVPLARPRDVQTLALRHDLVSLTVIGQHALVAGYRDAGGIALSVVAAGDRPRVVSEGQVPGRRLALFGGGGIQVGRAPDGAMTIALPTLAPGEPSRPWIPTSPRHFVLTADGQIRPAE